MSVQVFVYGTLLVPEMMQVVTGRPHSAVAATAQDYARSFIRDRVYPGIIAESGGRVAGLVYMDVDAQAIERLDYFEGPEYVRQTLPIQLADGAIASAEAYVVPVERRDILNGEAWRLSDFVARGLDEFLEHARQSMIDFRPGDRVVR